VVRNPFYQAAALWKYARAIGWSAAVRLRYNDLKARAGISKPSSLELRLKNSKFPLLMRTLTSDREVLEQVFIQREYEVAELSQPKMILDLGANVGYSSAYFLSRYGSASVLAVEPDPGNYAVCCRNLAPFGQRAKVIHGAAWVECTKLVLDKGTHGDGREWATQVRVATETSAALAHIDAFDLPTLIDMCPVPEIDLLKIDIERSEIELFSRNTENWLSHVRNLCIELHGPDCEAVFYRALSDYSYNLSHTGELTVCSDLRIRP
jgi:FkbM family methyltransferase